LRQSSFPQGWEQARVDGVLAHDELQTENEAIAEDEEACGASGQTVMEIPADLVPAVRELIAKHKAA
jgi:hypothetical protein